MELEIEEYTEELMSTVSIETNVSFNEILKSGERTMWVVPIDIMQVIDRNSLMCYVEV